MHVLRSAHLCGFKAGLECGLKGMLRVLRACWPRAAANRVRRPTLPRCRWIQKCSYLTYALSAIIQNQFDATTFYDESVSCWAVLLLCCAVLGCNAAAFVLSVRAPPAALLSAGAVSSPEDLPRLPPPRPSTGLVWTAAPRLNALPPPAPCPSFCVQGQPVLGSDLVPSNLQTGLSVEGNTLVLFALMVGTRLLAYASIEVGALLKVI